MDKYQEILKLIPLNNNITKIILEYIIFERPYHREYNDKTNLIVYIDSSFYYQNKSINVYNRLSISNNKCKIHKSKFYGHENWIVVG